LHTRPQPVTIAVVSLALLSLLNFTYPLVISPFLQTNHPTIVLFLGIALGVLGLLAGGGLWMLRRWGLLLTIIVSVLNILLAAPWIAVESQATGKLLAGVTVASFALVLFLVMQRNSRRAFAATSRLDEKPLGNRVFRVGKFRNLGAERVLKDKGQTD
jgi:peptidoglycan/LPS O-acetylase OafA/YrhL